MPQRPIIQYTSSSIPFKAHLELVVKRLNVVLDPLYELRLVLPDGPSDVSTHKQGIVARENTEHLVGALGRAQLVPEPSSNAGFHTVNTLIVPTMSTNTVSSDHVYRGIISIYNKRTQGMHFQVGLMVRKKMTRHHIIIWLVVPPQFLKAGSKYTLLKFKLTLLLKIEEVQPKYLEVWVIVFLESLQQDSSHQSEIGLYCCGPGYPLLYYYVQIKNGLGSSGFKLCYEDPAKPCKPVLMNKPDW